MDIPRRVIAGQHGFPCQVYGSWATHYSWKSDLSDNQGIGNAKLTAHLLDSLSETGFMLPSSLSPTAAPNGNLTVTNHQLAKLAIPESQGNLNATENIGTSTSSSIATSRKRQKTSEVWDHFTKEVLEGPDDTKAISNYCGGKFVARHTDGTNHLWRHTKRCPGSPVFQAQMQATLVPGLVQNPNWTFSQATSRELLAKMIIVHEYSFQIAEHPHFCAFVYSLQPRFEMIGQHTVREDCIKIYNQMKLKLMEEILTVQQVALTTDLWTSSDQTAYMVVTAHYINNKWELIKRIIGFNPLASPRNGPVISEQISQTLLEWNIMEKCTFMTLDNTSSNNAAVRQVQRIVDD
ncbi:hypothetical protein MJO29_005867 [Puccinia striiformis f. sp. tritici]|nr:hypothetical protein MJO29_005867 [Puccinia striiformis f. sp. tritici]